MFEILKIFILLLMLENGNMDNDNWCRDESFECIARPKSCEVNNIIDINKQGEITTFSNLIRLKKLNKIENENENFVNKDVIYINGTFDEEEKSFKLYGTEEFEKYSLYEKETDFNLVAYFSCDDESGNPIDSQKYILKLQMNDENLYEPVFSKEVYEFKISLPFIQGYECLLEKSIFATDHDIKYYKINFSTNNEYFDVTSIPDTENEKKSFVSFKLKKSITAIDEKLEVEIKAEDNGNPSKSSTAKLILTVDKQKSLIEPRFEKPSYNGYLNESKILHIQTVILSELTYDETVQFQQLGEDSDFFIISSNLNKIEIQLKDENFDDELIKNKTFLTFIIEAKHPQIQNPGQTVIFIDLPRKSGFPGGIHFEKSIYRGEIKENGELEIESIKLLDDNTENIYEFEIRNEDKNLFNYEVINKNELQLILKDDANWEDRSYLFITIAANLKGYKESSTTVVIDVPPFNNDFRFEKPLYTAKINQNNELENLEIKFVKNEPLDDIDLKLDGEESDKFEIVKSTDIIQIELKKLTELPSAWSKKKFLSFNIHALKHNHDEIFSAILINLPTKLQVPQFDEILYEGKIISNDQIDIPEIPVEKLGYTIFGLSGHNSFIFDQNNGKIKITLSKDLTDEDLKLDFIALTLKATFNEFDGQKSESATSIIFATPRSITPPGPTTPLPPDEEPPVFEKDLYRFSLKSDSIGKFGEVKALLNGKPSNEIKYSFGVIDDELKSRLVIHKDGSLELTATISPQIYTFEVLTTRLSINYNKVHVILEVSPIKYCGDKDSKVENALLVQTYKEEQPYYGILNTLEGNCRFKITKIGENDKDYFIINSTTNKLDLLSVDREDLKFSGMLVVQLQLTLALQDDPNKIQENIINNNQSENEINNNDYIELNNTVINDNSTLTQRTFSFLTQSKRVLQDERSYVLTKSIKSSTFETVLTIIVEDINDNSPIFKKPTSNPEYLIGYPDIELSDNILPEYLLQVYATDLDIGMNAEIRYKLENSDFGIEEKTGIIYPFSNAMKNSDELTFYVYAFDRDGKSDENVEIMRNSSMKITVKKIFSNQVALLEFQGTQIENVDELLRRASESKEFNLKPLKWATIPNKNDNDNGKKLSILQRASSLYNSLKVQSKSNQKITLKVWVYAFNKNNGIIETSDKIKEELSENSEIVVKSYQDQQSIILEEQNLIGFIVGIVILAIISIGCIGFIAWVFCFRQMLYEKMSIPERSDISSFAPSLEKNSLENGKETSPEISSYLKRESVKIIGTTTQETSDYQTRMLELLNDNRDSTNSSNGIGNGSINNYNDNMTVDDHDNNSYEYRSSNEGNLPNGDIGERRKSVVKFNELVERIEINERRDSEISAVSSERL